MVYFHDKTQHLAPARKRAAKGTSGWHGGQHLTSRNGEGPNQPTASPGKVLGLRNSQCDGIAADPVQKHTQA